MGRKTDYKYGLLTILFYFIYEFYFKYIVPKFNPYGPKRFAYFLSVGNTILVIFFLLLLYGFYKFKVNSIDGFEKKNIVISYIIFPIAFIFFDYYFRQDISRFVGSLLSANDKSIHNYYVPFWTFYITAVISPIIEEIVFRWMIFGFIFDFLDGSKEILRLITATIISSALFSMIHSPSVPSKFISYMLAGVGLSLIYYYSGRITSAIWTHSIRNLVSLILRNI